MGFLSLRVPLLVLLISADPLLLPTALRAEVRLPQILSSHAVLQRDQPLHIWGWAAPAEQVTVAFHNLTATATADRVGQWSVSLPPQPAGGPFSLTVSASNQIVLDDLLLGDVWFASGQSNMEMPLSGFPSSAVVTNGAEEIRNATHPDLRLLLIPRHASPYPLDEFHGEAAWTPCTPETAAKFSAVAYFFGREIASREHVAVGLIDSTWGGTPAEAWVSLPSLSADAALMPVFASWAAMAGTQSSTAALLQAEKREDEAARQAHSPLPKHPWHPSYESWEPAWLFNAMVAPATPLSLKGVIWYQGESNASADRAPLYHRVFSTLIEDWRRHWNQGDFPFLFTQISSFGAGSSDDWPLVRDAQRRTLGLANTAMAVTIDVGDAANVHPPDKQTVGARLALAARAVAYGEKLEFSGPLFRTASPENSALRVWFDHAADGLVLKEGADPEGFEVAGADGHFQPAAAHISGASVLVSSPAVPSPLYVRYAWKSVPDANLFNAAGLPASPFTSR